MTENYTLSDIAAVTDGNRNNGMFGNDSWAWIVILLLFGYGRNGFGGFGGGQGGCGMPCGVPATQADLAAGFASNATLNGINGIDSALCQGFNGINTAILQSGYNTQTSINGLSHQLADCCCATQRAIDGVKYENATNTCAIQNTIQNTTRDVIDNANANSRAILDFLTQDKIAALTAENQTLKFAASQANQNMALGAMMDANTAEILRRVAPTPVPAYPVCNPNIPHGYGWGFNSGCGCNC